LLSYGWLMRALLGLGGVVTLLLCLPVARAAYDAQRADSVLSAFREGRPVTQPALRAGIQALDKAVEIEPSPERLFKRSDVLASAALSQSLKTPEAERTEWLKQAQADLKRGLSRDAARPAEWLSLASVSEALNGSSRDLVPMILMSIYTGRMLENLWPARMRLILSNWAYFTEEEKEKLKDYVVLTWRLEADRRWFGRMVYDVFDEVIIRSLLRDEPMKSQEELSRYIRDARK